MEISVDDSSFNVNVQDGNGADETLIGGLNDLQGLSLADGGGGGGGGGGNVGNTGILLDFWPYHTCCPSLFVPLFKYTSIAAIWLKTLNLS